MVQPPRFQFLWAGGCGATLSVLHFHLPGLAAEPVISGEGQNLRSCDGCWLFKRLRATAGQGPNYVGPLCGYVGLCWRMLAYLAGNVGPSCGYVGLCWPHVDP